MRSAFPHFTCVISIRIIYSRTYQNSNGRIHLLRSYGTPRSIRTRIIRVIIIVYCLCFFICAANNKIDHLRVIISFECVSYRQCICRSARCVFVFQCITKWCYCHSCCSGVQSPCFWSFNFLKFPNLNFLLIELFTGRLIFIFFVSVISVLYNSFLIRNLHSSISSGSSSVLLRVHGIYLRVLRVCLHAVWCYLGQDRNRVLNWKSKYIARYLINPEYCYSLKMRMCY